jgi:hypothetical protein
MLKRDQLNAFEKFVHLQRQPAQLCHWNLTNDYVSEGPSLSLSQLSAYWVGISSTGLIGFCGGCYLLM